MTNSDCINKPPGFAVHGGSSIAAGVVELLRVMRNQPRIELAHRLIETPQDACVVKNASRVQAAFRARSVKKSYSLIVVAMAKKLAQFNWALEICNGLG